MKKKPLPPAALKTIEALKRKLCTPDRCREIAHGVLRHRKDCEAMAGLKRSAGRVVLGEGVLSAWTLFGEWKPSSVFVQPHFYFPQRLIGQKGRLVWEVLP